MSNEKITDRDRKFAHNLLIGMTVVDAAMDAGYAKTTAYKVAHLWIGKTRKESQKPELFDFIQEKRKGLEKEFDVTEKDVLRGMHRIAMFDVRKLYDENGDLIPVHKLPDDVALALQGIKVIETSDKSGRKKSKTVVLLKEYKQADRNAALANIAKLLGYNAAEKIQHEVGPSLIDLMKQVTAESNGK